MKVVLEELLNHRSVGHAESRARLPEDRQESHVKEQGEELHFGEAIVVVDVDGLHDAAAVDALAANRLEADSAERLQIGERENSARLSEIDAGGGD